jgi:hypothetical protein
MTYSELDYRNGTAYCPVEGCGWSVPKGKEIHWPNHRDDHHNGEI